MTSARCSEADFIHLIETVGPSETARKLKCSITSVFQRRTNLEGKLGRQITGPDQTRRATRHNISHPNWLNFTIKNGHVLVGSDCHYWPGIISTAHRAFVHFAKEYQPKAVVMNGDVLDGAQISRHPPIGWEKRPTLIQEIEACTERLTEVEKAAPNAKEFWTLGNHCARFETRLATVAPEYARVHGTSLKDHFPYWQPCWSLCINDEVVIKHRDKGGQHAPFNNTLRSGRTIITGHLHSLKVQPFTDYNGTRFGVDCGTLADPYGPQFEDYTEHKSLDWRSGFVLLTFANGRLLWPEIVPVTGDGEVQFRGKVIRV